MFYHIITEYPSSIITLQLLLAINLCCVHVRSHCSYHIQTKYGPSLPSGHERDSTHTRYPAIKAGINPHRPDTGNNVPTSITWRGPEACSQANSSGTGMSHCTTQWIYHHNDIIIPYMLVSMCKSLLIFFFSQRFITQLPKHISHECNSLLCIFFFNSYTINHILIA